MPQRTAMFTVKEARKFLRTPGTEVAIQAMCDGPFVMARKSDFIAVYDGYFVDYDGGANNCFAEGNVLYIPSGTGCSADEPCDYSDYVTMVVAEFDRSYG